MSWRYTGITGKGGVAGLVLVTALVPLLAGCGGSYHESMLQDESFHSFTAEEIQLRENASLKRYRLGPGDVIEVDFLYQDDLDKDRILILPDGRIAVAGFDDIRAAGMTVSELDSVLTERFSREFRNPDLSVGVKEISKQEVYVFGEVGHPGSYTLNTMQTGVLQAIAMAGGFTSDASTSEVLVIRAVPEGYYYRLVDLSHLEKRGPEGLFAADIQGNDLVYVPRSAMGDLKQFSDSFLLSASRVSDIFWDIYAITHLNKVDRIVR